MKVCFCRYLPCSASIQHIRDYPGNCIALPYIACTQCGSKARELPLTLGKPTCIKQNTFDMQERTDHALPQAVDQEQGTDLDPSNTQAAGGRGGVGPPQGFRGPVSDSPPELGSIQRASIRSIKPYGVFVQMEGFRSNALVHLSQVPTARSEALHYYATWLSFCCVSVPRMSSDTPPDCLLPACSFSMTQ